jgi:hypothetical protein
MNGPISDVVVDGLYLDHSLFGLRILSSASRVDRIAVRNIHGDSRGWAITIDNFFGNFRNGPGNMGGITIENVDVHSDKGGTGRTNQYINIGCGIESLTLKNVRQSHRVDDRPVITLAKEARIQRLLVDGLSIQDTEKIEDTLPRIALVGEAEIDHCSLSNLTWLRPAELPSGGTLLETLGTGGISVLQLQGVAVPRGAQVVKQTGGKVGKTISSNVVEETADK